MDRIDRPGLGVRIIWFDDDMIEMESTVNYRGFRGTSTCYCTSEDVTTFASALSQLANTAEGIAPFDAGLSDGSKRIALRAYTTDLSGHLAVHVSLATDAFSRRPESIWRVEVEMKTESWSVSRFAEQLESIAKTRQGYAFLPTVD